MEKTEKYLIVVYKEELVMDLKNYYKPWYELDTYIEWWNKILQNMYNGFDLYT